MSPDERREAEDAAAESHQEPVPTETALADAAYARGTQRFMGVELIAAPGALVPRAESELLGRTAVATLASLAEAGGRTLSVIDMGCGSGNLACGIAVAVPQARIWAADLTDGCVSIARRNVAKLGLSSRIEVAQGDLFGALAGLGLEGGIDLIVCNPPYISTGRLEQRSDLRQEPREAFDGGPYGLSIHQRVVKDAVAFLRPGGWLTIEFGLGQHRQVKILFDRTRGYEAVEFVPNEMGEPRVAMARKRTSS